MRTRPPGGRIGFASGASREGISAACHDAVDARRDAGHHDGRSRGALARPQPDAWRATSSWPSSPIAWRGIRTSISKCRVTIHESLGAVVAAIRRELSTFPGVHQINDSIQAGKEELKPQGDTCRPGVGYFARGSRPASAAGVLRRGGAARPARARRCPHHGALRRVGAALARLALRLARAYSRRRRGAVRNGCRRTPWPGARRHRTQGRRPHRERDCGRRCAGQYRPRPSWGNSTRAFSNGPSRRTRA